MKTAGAILLLCVLGCSMHALSERPMVQDIHSASRPAEARVTHAEIDWTLDFEARRLRGSVTWSLERPPGAADAPLVLDTRGLEIEEVQAGREGALRRASFNLAPPEPVTGRALVVPLRAGDDRVLVRYATTDASAGLQWLAPAQTAAKTHPFLYSQAQAILARTFLPCQDSPQVRFTYRARVRPPPGLRAVMAARALPRAGDDAPFEFEMPEPIPSYLVAVAAGDLRYRELGPRSGIYAEPPVLEAAAWEFSETESMIAAAEALYGAYRWERYDILVLPPSFPFGGMENPRLTFATPTAIAGDRSAVALVAHELAHSWSGNLVTNATWSDFWLNEGFTVYFERRIMEAVYGPERAAMEAVIGRRDLLNEMKSLDPRDTVLHVALEGRDPDDAFSSVPYEKGYLLLRLIEERLGRTRFDAILSEWFEANAFRSRTTEDWVRFLAGKELVDGGRPLAEAIGLSRWLHEPGLPENAPTTESPALAAVRERARAFAAGGGIEDVPGEGWSTHEWLHFLESLPEAMEGSRLAALDARFALTASRNAEVLTRWLLLAIRSGYAPADAALESFLLRQGRRKFLKPLYTELARTPEGRARALAIYERARPLYHAISARTLDEILAPDAPR